VCMVGWVNVILLALVVFDENKWSILEHCEAPRTPCGAETLALPDPPLPIVADAVYCLTPLPHRQPFRLRCAP